MKRGSKFFEDFSSDGNIENKGNRGRSKKMLEKRNDKIFHRYFYYSRIIQINYEGVLAALVIDFDLTESTLVQLIEKNTKRITEIRNANPTRPQLKNMFPNFFWYDKAAVVESLKEREVFNLK